MAAGSSRHQPGHPRNGVARRAAQPAPSPGTEDRVPVDSTAARVHGRSRMAEEAVNGAPFLDNYRARFELSWKDETPIEQVRFVVLDCETTGLNPRTDRIITIGAVAVRDGEIVLGDSFE